MEMTGWLALAIAWAVFASVMACVFFRDSRHHSDQHKRAKQLLEEIRERQHRLSGDLSDAQAMRDKYRDDLLCAKHRAEKAAAELRVQASVLDGVKSVAPKIETRGM